MRKWKSYLTTLILCLSALSLQSSTLMATAVPAAPKNLKGVVDAPKPHEYLLSAACVNITVAKNFRIHIPIDADGTPNTSKAYNKGDIVFVMKSEAAAKQAGCVIEKQ